MAETTEKENIGGVDTFESVDYSDRITVADGAGLVINATPGYKGFKDNLTDPIEFIFTEGKNAKIEGVLFFIQQPF